MTKLFPTLMLLGACVPALATQETFTTAGPVIVTGAPPLTCSQNTSDNLFTINVDCTYPASGPSPTGFNVYAPVVEIASAIGPTFDMSAMQISLTGSDFFNGTNYIGAIQLETRDAAGTWTYVTQWSSYIGSSKGIYVMFNGRSLTSPLVQGVSGIRLTAVNGATTFRIGMMNLTAH